jgi:protein disulfide-isomerase A6
MARAVAPQRRRTSTSSALPLLLLAVSAIAATTPAASAASAPLVELDDSSLPTFLKDLSGVALVAFTAEWCGHCKALHSSGALDKAAEALRGIVPVAHIDADKNKAAASEHQIGGFPTIKLFYRDPSTGAVRSQPYAQAGRSAKDLASFALDKASSLAFKRLGEKKANKGGGGGGGGAGSCGGGGAGGGGAGTCGGGGGGGGGGGAGSCGGGGAGGGGARGGGGGGNSNDFFAGSKVVSLNEQSFEDDVRHGQDLWFVIFYAPWCGHCQRAKSEVVAAADALSGRVRVGAVDCTQEQALCASRGVRGYPTFKFYAGGASSSGGDHEEEDYQGGRDSAAMIEFLSAKHAELGPPPEVKEVVDSHAVEAGCLGDGSLLGGGGDDEGEDKNGGEASSSSARQLCFFAFLPDVLDTGAAGRQAYLSALKKLAEAHKGRPWAYFWSSAGKQPKLEEALTGGAGVVPPLLVAYKPSSGGEEGGGSGGSKGKYSTMRGAFDEANMRAFVESLRRGREPVAEVATTTAGSGGGAGSLAALVEASEPWDGKDGAPPTLDDEEEFSLDEIMAA